MVAIDDATEGQFVSLLGYIYGAVDWRGMRTAKNPWDIWEHRVRTSSTTGTMGEFVSRLCALFGLQSLPMEAVELVSLLRPHEGILLDLVNREHTVMAMRGVQASRAIKAARKGAKQEATTSW